LKLSLEHTDLPNCVANWAWRTTKCGVLQNWVDLSYEDHAKS